MSLCPLHPKYPSAFDGCVRCYMETIECETPVIAPAEMQAKDEEPF